MAVKKKSAAKKVVKKAAKKVVKKAAVKKVAKKAAVKKVAKKAAVKKVAKKAASLNKLVVPPVPLTGLRSSSPVNVTTTPALKSTPAKPSAAPKQSTSPRVFFIAVVGIALLAFVVISRPTSDSDQLMPAASSSAVSSASPEMSEEATPTEPAAEPQSEAVEAIAEPTRFIGNWKDSGKSVMVITWRAPSATSGLTGYKFEVRSGMGEWKEAGALPVDQLSIELTKKSTDGSTSFRVSSVYSDGQMALAKAFGFSGQFE